MDQKTSPVPLAYWRTYYNSILQEMWWESRKGMGGICMVCSTCGGGSASYCFCVQQRYINSIKFADLQKYAEKERIKLDKSENEVTQSDAFFKVVKNGQHFNPAGQHYGRAPYVLCDSCGKHEYKSCIGYGSMDLCLACVMEINDPPISLPIVNWETNSRYFDLDDKIEQDPRDFPPRPNRHVHYDLD